MFGRDTVNTYGPLSFLVHPIAYKNNYYFSVLFRISIWIISLVLLHLIVKQTNTRSHLSLLPLAFVTFIVNDYSFVFGADHKNYEKILHNNNITLYIILITLAAASSNTKNRHLYIAALAFSTTALALVKFQYGIILAACTFFVLCFSIHTGKHGFLRTILWTACGVLVAAPFYAWILQDASNVFLFVRGSLEIASGYSETVSLQGPSRDLLWAALLIAMFSSTIIFEENKTYTFIYIAAIFFCFIFFKHAFTRHDIHSNSFFLGFCLLISALVVTTRNRKATSILLVATSLSLLILLIQTKSICFKTDSCLRSSFDRITSKMSFDYTKGIFDFYRPNPRAPDPKSLHYPLCDEIVSITGNKKTSLWTLNIMSIYATGINFFPFYVYQEYNNYTPYLDEMTAGKIDNDTSLQYIILHFDSIDQRNPFIDSPETMSLLSEQFAATEKCGIYLLTRKAVPARRQPPILLENRTARPQEPISIPRHNDRVFMTISLDYTLLGKLHVMARNLPPLYIVMTDDDDAEHTFRFSPKPVTKPFLVSTIPRTKDQLGKHFNNERYPKVRTVRLSGPGLKYFNSEIKVSLFTKPALAEQLSVTSRPPD